MSGQRNKRRLVREIGWALLAALLVAPSTAWAQADTDPPLPNVMLLIDTSGSMEYMAEPDTDGNPELPNCAKPNPLNSQNYSFSNKAYKQNRWTNLVTVLTGEIPRFACVAESRSTTTFRNEFGIGGKEPYDRDYYLPYNRIVALDELGSERCVIGPNTSVWPGSNLFSYPSNAILTHRVGLPGSACALIKGAPRLYQDDDGLLDVFREKARFGLMTFDNLPDFRTGYTGGAVDYDGGLQGLWSYYDGWDQNGSGYAKGKPEMCTTAQAIEVGARNPAAPPWEGRLIAFGNPGASLSEISLRNEQIQQTIMAVRPYGATPLAGMLADAEHFFFHDTTTDKADSNLKPFGPYNDPYVLGGCRQQFAILLTDGIPNLDLRPGCKNNQPGPPDGTCPFSEPAAIAKRLATPPNPNQKVRTFVVGFAVSSAEAGGGTKLDCKTLTGQNDNACLNPATDAVRACCEMAKIAYEGGTSKPRFADNKLELRKALNDILSEVAQSTTSRTTPVFANAGSAGGGYSGGLGTAAYNILTSFKVSTGGLWQGVIERQRYICDKSSGVYNVKSEAIDAEKGDSFATNLALGLGPERRFYTVVPNTSTTQNKADRTIRKVNSIGDGLGSLIQQKITDLQGNFANSNISDAMGLADTGAPQSVCGTAKDPVSVTNCRTRILRWYTGLSMVDGSIFDRVSSPLGSIYHSTPVVVGPPSEFLRDESYSAFAEKYKYRSPILYSATTDGQLHAFKMGPSSPTDTVKVDNKNNNELWSFIPPAILPDLKTIYPGVERRLLDTPIVARDVVFERKRADALSGAGSFNNWRSVLVTGLGPTRGGYFALDVTSPEYDSSATNKGPELLWQITTDSDGKRLFGASVTPVITTIFAKLAGMPEAREIAVAILPGGTSAPPSNSTAVSRSQTGSQTVDGKWKFRAQVRSYADTDPARSLTIVRLDTGEVIRRFHRCKPGGQPPIAYDASLLARSVCTPFDSPITSVPLPFPNGTGQSSTRVFVGDQDGAMWRLDVSSTDPNDWKVAPFFDAYAPYSDAFVGQPILSQPVAALDPLGNLVLSFATGDQDRFDGTAGMRNVIWSVSEVPNLLAGTVGAKANWHLGINNNESVQATPSGSANGDWTNGIRVAGPLSLFGGAVYFSTYKPPVAGGDACDPGSSVLWAVDYLKNTADDAMGDAAPKAALDISGVLYHAKQYSNALIFGVGIQKLPACYDTSTVDDPYIGYGSGATSVAGMTQPEYKLVIQTGSKGANNAQAETKFETLALRPPPSGALISSWASVVELTRRTCESFC